MLNFFSKKNVCLCLSGGGALGFAHIGVIQALEENNIYPGHVSGTSMGAVIGVFYAAGFTSAEMLQLIKDYKLYKITTLLTLKHLRHKGFSDHSTLRKLIREQIPHNSFEGLKRKFMLCVANLSNAQWEIINAGKKLDMWVAASASIPGVFETIKHNKSVYSDGGILNNLPAQPFESDFRTTIGVDVITYTHLKTPPVESITDTALTAMRAMQHQNSAEGRDICRYLIEPQLIPDFHEFSFDAYLNIYKAGYEATIKYISKNRDILSLKNE